MLAPLFRVGLHRLRVWGVLVVASLGVPAGAQVMDLSPVGLDLVRPHIQEGRWVWMGDSFAVPTRRRIPFATLLTWPLDRIGAVVAGPSSTLAMATPTSRQARWITAEDGYLLGQGTRQQEPMGLPVYRLLEAALPMGATSIAEVSINRAALADGNAGAVGRALSGDAAARPLLFVQEGSLARGTVGLGGSMMPLGVPGFGLGAALRLGTTARLAIALGADLASPGLVHLAGAMVAGQPGHTAQYLADVSWSTVGFATDAPPMLPDRAKQFQTERLASYLAATTLDPAQASVVVLYLAPEDKQPQVLQEVVREAVARIREAYARAELPPPVVLLLHSHAIQTEGIPDAATNEAFGVGLREAALSDPGVAFVSLYASTGGVVFDGRPEAVAWLQAEGWAELTYGTHVAGLDGPVRLVADEGGNLLDSRQLHPTEAGAAFFSAVLYQALTDVPEARGGIAVQTVFAPNPARRGGRVTGAGSDLPIYDVRGRRVGRTSADGSFVAPATAGVYVVGRARLVVQ